MQGQILIVFLHVLCALLAMIVTNSVSQGCDNVSYRECNTYLHCILNCGLTHFEMQQLCACVPWSLNACACIQYGPYTMTHLKLSYLALLVTELC